MKQGRFYSATRVSACTAVVTFLMSGAAHAEAITKPMSWTPPSGKTPGPIEGTSAVLEKGPFGAAMAVKSTGLTPGDVVTIWWVAIQKPEMCAESPCSPKDAMGNSAVVDSVVTLAAGSVVDEDGTISLASFLPKGEVFHNPYASEKSFKDGKLAEVHPPPRYGEAVYAGYREILSKAAV